MKKILKNRTLLLAIFSCALFTMTSCLQEIGVDSFDEVKLQASLEPTCIETKAPLDQNTTEDLQIGLTRVDETDDKGTKNINYPYFDGVTTVLAATMKPGKPDVNTRDITFDHPQKFLNSTSKIRFAAWYPFVPEDKIETASINKAIDGKTDILYGKKITTGSMNQDFDLINFNHALVKYTIKVYAMLKENDNDPNSVENKWGKLKEIKIKSLPTSCNIDLPTKKRVEKDPEKDPDKCVISYNKTPTQEYFASYNNTPLDITLPIGKANAITLDAILAAPPTDRILDISVGTTKGSTGGETIYQPLSIAGDFQKGHNYEIFLRFSDNGIINAEIAVGAWQQGEDIKNETINNDIYYDLSSAEKANSYIVTSANYNYCFDITTKGNGVAGVIEAKNLKINPRYVDILWIDENIKQYIEVSNHPIQNRATFKVKNDNTGTEKEDHKLSAEGNVLIGAYDKDPAYGGKLLWTWHIWLTDRPANQAYQNGFVAQDRDLGAINSTINQNDNEIDGLYYQWGRPTPLPFGKTVVNAKGTTFEITTETSKKIDLDVSITHPDKFYTEPLSHPNLNGLWGYVEPTTPYTKTPYDPCPPGYRLPSRQLYNYIDHFEIIRSGHAFNSNVETYYTLTSPITGYYTYENSNITRKGHSADKAPNGSYLWSGTPNMKGQFYQLSCIDDKPIQSGQSAIANPTNALPVRCVSVRSKPEVINLSAYQTANCYIVPRKGFYQFKVDTRGNGVSELITIKGDGSKNISEGLSTYIGNDVGMIAPLWWQGVPGDNRDPNMENVIPIRIINGDKITDGYSFFSVGNWAPGNLIVAAWNLKGTEILWTWHLWLTEEPESHESCAYAVMDRYLGATSIPRPTISDPDNTDKVTITETEALGSMGLYYQFGRKDPFPRPEKIQNSTDGTATVGTWWKYDKGTKKWVKKEGLESKTTDQTRKSIPNSVKDPTCYFLAQNSMFGSGPIPEKLNYQTDLQEIDNDGNNACFSTWKRYADRGGVWGFNAFETSFAVTGSKSMYDPCPPGYTVPYYLVWSYPIDANIMVLIDREDGLNTKPPVIKSTYGIILKKNVPVHLPDGTTINASFDQTWYPYTGYIHGSNGNLYECGSVGRFQSTSMAGKSSARSIFYKKINNTTVHTGQAVVASPATGVPTSFGFPVRCVKE